MSPISPYLSGGAAILALVVAFVLAKYRAPFQATMFGLIGMIAAGLAVCQALGIR